MLLVRGGRVRRCRSSHRWRLRAVVGGDKIVCWAGRQQPSVVQWQWQRGRGDIESRIVKWSGCWPSMHLLPSTVVALCLTHLQYPAGGGGFATYPCCTAHCTLKLKKFLSFELGAQKNASSRVSQVAGGSHTHTGHYTHISHTHTFAHVTSHVPHIILYYCAFIAYTPPHIVIGWPHWQAGRLWLWRQHGHGSMDAAY